MGMSQAYSSNIRLAVAAPRLLVKARRGRRGWTDSRTARQLNSGEAVALRGKECAIVQQAIAGNADAQEHLFAPHAGRLYHTAFAVLHNKEDAEDALQDAMCKAFTRLRSFQGRSSFSTWLMRIVVNSALMTRRRKSSHPEASLDEILHSQPERLPQEAADVQPDPENTCAAIELKALVEEHVRQLPPALQTAFRLRAINGLSSTESSEALGFWENAFRSQFFRARRKLACGLKRSREIRAIALMSGRRGTLIRKG
jgi:RNA polymerase sigma-70 factor (ECF subfamily)